MMVFGKSLLFHVVAFLDQSVVIIRLSVKNEFSESDL